jgi:hypothetical protein
MNGKEALYGVLDPTTALSRRRRRRRRRRKKIC